MDIYITADISDISESAAVSRVSYRSDTYIYHIQRSGKISTQEMASTDAGHGWEKILS